MQNIYDNPIFFDGYSRLREKTDNANDLFETPALMGLLPDVAGCAVLDLGCGMGDHCAEYVRRGAAKVVGIDISEKMLAAARERNGGPRIEYLRLPMEQLGALDGPFDVVASSLAIHYVADYAGLAANVFRLLKPGGVFAFSQEHPLTSCFTTGERWTKNEKGEKVFANISNYSVDGERLTEWMVEGVRKYHRTFSTVVNTLVDAGFAVERLVEPVPDAEMRRAYPRHADLVHKPDFLLVRALRAVSSEASCGNV